MVAKLKSGEVAESNRAARAHSAEVARFYIHRAGEELEKAAGIASRLQNKSDRVHICEAIWQAKVTLNQVSLRSRGNPQVGQLLWGDARCGLHRQSIRGTRRRRRFFQTSI